MTPFDLLLGGSGPMVLLGAIALAAVLTLLAAALEIALTRLGGVDPGAEPDWFARHGPAVFMFAGLPALVIAFLTAIGLTLSLGGSEDITDISSLWVVLLDLAVIAAVVGCGVGAPVTQHWGLGIALFAAGIGAIFPLLFITNALPFENGGGLEQPQLSIFALTVGLMLVALVLAAAALIALAVTSLRTWRSLHAVRSARPAPRLTLVE